MTSLVSVFEKSHFLSRKYNKLIYIVWTNQMSKRPIQRSRLDFGNTIHIINSEYIFQLFKLRTTYYWTWNAIRKIEVEILGLQSSDLSELINYNFIIKIFFSLFWKFVPIFIKKELHMEILLDDIISQTLKVNTTWRSNHVRHCILFAFQLKKCSRSERNDLFRFKRKCVSESTCKRWYKKISIFPINIVREHQKKLKRNWISKIAVARKSLSNTKACWITWCHLTSDFPLQKLGRIQGWLLSPACA